MATMQHKNAFQSMFPGRSDRVFFTHLFNRTNGNAIFCVVGVGTAGGVVSAWEEPSSDSGSPPPPDSGSPPPSGFSSSPSGFSPPPSSSTPPVSAPPTLQASLGPGFRSVSNGRARRNSVVGIPTDIGWGEGIQVPTSQLQGVLDIYKAGLLEHKKWIWLPAFILSPYPYFMFGYSGDVKWVAKRKGMMVWIKERKKGRKKYVPVVNGMEMEDFAGNSFGEVAFQIDLLG